MRVAVASDLHLEFKELELKNDAGADVLILSGDILIAEDLYQHPDTDHITHPLGTRQESAKRFRDFIKQVSSEFKSVIYVAGNHELYHGKWNKSIQVLRDEMANYDNVYFLEMDTVTINDVLFVGGTLWTDLNKGDPLTRHAVRDMMQDYAVIRNDQYGYRKLLPNDTYERHLKTKEYIKLVVSQNKDKKCVVVGHHAPTKLSTHPKYKDEYLMNGAYSSDLSDLMLDHPNIVLWTHGHTHDPFDYMIGDTRVVCNPRGYIGWDPHAEYFELMFLDI